MRLAGDCRTRSPLALPPGRSRNIWSLVLLWLVSLVLLWFIAIAAPQRSWTIAMSHVSGEPVTDISDQDGAEYDGAVDAPSWAPGDIGFTSLCSSSGVLGIEPGKCRPYIPRGPPDLKSAPPSSCSLRAPSQIQVAVTAVPPVHIAGCLPDVQSTSRWGTPVHRVEHQPSDDERDEVGTWDSAQIPT
jgi:hypothetical protein